MLQISTGSLGVHECKSPGLTGSIKIQTTGRPKVGNTEKLLRSINCDANNAYILYAFARFFARGEALRRARDNTLLGDHGIDHETQLLYKKIQYAMGASFISSTACSRKPGKGANMNSDGADERAISQDLLLFISRGARRVIGERLSKSCRNSYELMSYVDFYHSLKKPMFMRPFKQLLAHLKTVTKNPRCSPRLRSQQHVLIDFVEGVRKKHGFRVGVGSESNMKLAWSENDDLEFPSCEFMVDGQDIVPIMIE